MSDKVCNIMNCEHYSDCVCAFCDCLEKAYNKGRADGYHKAENDYFENSQKDRTDAYNCGYEVGRIDAIDEFQKWYTDLMNNPPSAIVPYSLIFDKLEQMKGEAHETD